MRITDGNRFMDLTKREEKLYEKLFTLGLSGRATCDEAKSMAFSDILAERLRLIAKKHAKAAQFQLFADAAQRRPMS